MRYTDNKYLYLENDNGIKSQFLHFGTDDLKFECMDQNIEFIIRINDDNSLDIDFDDESDLILEEDNLTSLEKNYILNLIKELLIENNPLIKLIFE
jgi:hypothetical protein